MTRRKNCAGVAGTVSNTADGVTFRLSQKRSPTSVGTSLTYGAIHMHIFHNWEERRAGKYREGAWPTDTIRAQLNYLFAAREMCRAMGYANSGKTDFNGDIRLYGFESNFPNGHVDHPPHFHVMLGWPGWTGTQADHFILDEKGKIPENQLIADMGNRQEHADFHPDEICRIRDPEGKIGFELIVEKDGNGVIMRRAAGHPEFRIHASSSGVGAIDSVEVNRREAGETLWGPLCNVRVEDDAVKGKMAIAILPANGKNTGEVITYDVDTGALRSTDESDPSSRL